MENSIIAKSLYLVNKQAKKLRDESTKIFDFLYYNGDCNDKTIKNNFKSKAIY